MPAITDCLLLTSWPDLRRDCQNKRLGKERKNGKQAVAKSCSVIHIGQITIQTVLQLRLSHFVNTSWDIVTEEATQFSIDFRITRRKGISLTYIQ